MEFDQLRGHTSEAHRTATQAIDIEPHNRGDSLDLSGLRARRSTRLIAAPMVGGLEISFALTCQSE